jgi:hypothetical protein
MTTAAAVDINDHGIKEAFLVVEQGSDTPATQANEISVCDIFDTASRKQAESSPCGSGGLRLDSGPIILLYQRPSAPVSRG